MKVPYVKETFQVDVKAMEKEINGNTILLLVSAAQFCHGVVDPVD